MRKGTKRILGAGIIGGLAYAGWRAWKAQVASEGAVTWDSSAPFPFPPVPRPASPAPAAAPAAPPAASTSPAPAAIEPFTEPAADGTCPTTHPIKAKLTSGIYHVPGGGNYDRTKPDRCYASADAAEADGLRPAKR